jgi:hypothetical protein
VFRNFFNFYEEEEWAEAEEAKVVLFVKEDEVEVGLSCDLLIEETFCVLFIPLLPKVLALILLF